MSDFKELKDTVIRYAGQASGGEFEKLVNVTMNGVYRRLLDMSRVPHEHREFSLTTVLVLRSMECLCMYAGLQI